MPKRQFDGHIHKKSLSVIARRRAILAVLLGALLLACQPTPETEFIVNRGDNLAEKRIEETPAPTGSGTDQPLPTFAVPERWTDVIETKVTTIPIDAEIVTSGQTVFPVRTVERTAIQEDMMLSLWRAFFPDAVAWHSGLSFYTRKDYENALKSAVDHGLENEVLLNLQAEYNACRLTEDDFQPMETFRLHLEDYVVTVLLADGSKGSMEWDLTGREVVLCRHTHALLHDSDTLSIMGSYIGDPVRSITPSLPQDKAITAGEQFLTEQHMEGWTLASAQPGRLFQSLGFEEWSTGWILKYVHAFEYVPLNVSDVDHGSFSSEEVSYAPAWAMEELELYVSENGVERLRWSDPMTVTGVANENVTLLPFAEMQRIMKNYFTAAIAGEKIKWGYQLELTKVVLTLSVQPKKNAAKEAYLVPTWVCLMDAYDLHHEKQTDKPFAYGFNAIDGTRVHMGGSFR